MKHKDKIEKAQREILIDSIEDILKANTPTFSFALREDLKDDKRFLPTQAEPLATGYDVRAAMTDRQPLIVEPFQYLKIPLGCRGFCPEGWWYEVKPRSSTFAKKNLHALYGTIDQGFEGELVFACQYIPELNFTEGNRDGDFYYIRGVYGLLPKITINFGDAIGQIIPIKRESMKVVEWSNEEYDNACKKRNGTRGAGGFGSTGA